MTNAKAIDAARAYLATLESPRAAPDMIAEKFAALNAATDSRGSARVYLRCKECGSDRLSCDACAEWDAEAGEWVLQSTQDNVTCQHCDADGWDVAEECDTASAPLSVAQILRRVAKMEGAALPEGPLGIHPGNFTSAILARLKSGMGDARDVARLQERIKEREAQS